MYSCIHIFQLVMTHFVNFGKRIKKSLYKCDTKIEMVDCNQQKKNDTLPVVISIYNHHKGIIIEV